MDISDVPYALKLALIIILNLIIIIIVLRTFIFLIRVSGIDLYHPFMKIINFFKRLIKKIINRFKNQ